MTLSQKFKDYFNLSKELFVQFDDNFSKYEKNGEWYYLPSEVKQNQDLLKQLNDLGLLKEHVKMVDCGIGLGASLFDFYLQSKEISDKSFSFTGIEKNDTYITYLLTKLWPFWEDNLDLIEGDIMDHNYSEYDIVYTYWPIKDITKQIQLYYKISSDIKPGSIMIENQNRGLGQENSLLMVLGLRRIDLEKVTVFVKY